MRHSKLSRLAVFALGVVLLAPWFAHAQSVEEQPSFLAMTGDLLIARPALLVTTVAGAAVFLVSLPFTAAGGNVESAAQTLVGGPAEATFVRCLGCRNTRNPRSETNTQ
jgi:hypothetical protein